jgi:hypothetical protein
MAGVQRHHNDDRGGVTMAEMSLEQAFDEACRALGESIVRNNFLIAELRRRDEEQVNPEPKDNGHAVPS